MDDVSKMKMFSCDITEGFHDNSSRDSAGTESHGVQIHCLTSQISANKHPGFIVYTSQTTVLTISLVPSTQWHHKIAHDVTVCVT